MDKLLLSRPFPVLFDGTSLAAVSSLPESVGMVYSIYSGKPRLSGPPLSGTSIIQLGNFFLNSENVRVP